MYHWNTNIILCDKLLSYVENDTFLFDEHVEGFMRMVISRAYYACFHELKAKNEHFGIHPEVNSSYSHDNVIDALLAYPETCDRANISRLRNQMKQLKDYRKKADYEEQHTFSKDYAREILKKSQRILNAIRTIEETSE